MAEINSSARLPILQLNWLSTSRAPDSTSLVADSVATQGCCSVAPRTPRGRKSFFCFGTKTANRAQEGSQSCDQKASLEPGEGLVSVSMKHPGSRAAVPGCCCFGCKSMSSRSQERLYLVTVYRYSTKIRMFGRQKWHVMQHDNKPLRPLQSP